MVNILFLYRFVINNLCETSHKPSLLDLTCSDTFWLNKEFGCSRKQRDTFKKR